MIRSFLKRCLLGAVAFFVLGFIALLILGIVDSSKFGTEVRQWADLEGRTLQGALVVGSPEEALLRVLPANRIYRVPLSRLSEPDRDYVRGHQMDHELFGDLYPGVKNQWPSKIEGRQQPINLTSSNQGKTWESTHYEFRSDVPVNPKVAEGIAVTCEAIDLALKDSPLPLTWGRSSDKKRVVILYHSDTDFYRSGAQDNWGAYYHTGTNQVHVPLSATRNEKPKGSYSRFTLDKRNSYKIFVHEMVHQACTSLSALRLPAWIPEGTAELYSALQTSPGFFNFVNHPVQIRRHLSERLGGGEILQVQEVELPNLDRFLTLGLNGFNNTTAASPNGGQCEYSAALLLTEYFCFEDGNSLRHYLEAVLTGVNPKNALEMHLLRGRTPHEIEGLIMNRWKKFGMALRFVKHPEIRIQQFTPDVGIGSKLSSPF
ncbi:MAG: hypothetical protein KA250_04170 [Verrucomicrobiales bacterium]|jgi:hypothetical protein|nr:hypothetical protein [Verrucomicrobiales bacterium]MBP9224274.1 hypothetical protein [Verrucomicrobiales bacterium]